VIKILDILDNLEEQNLGRDVSCRTRENLNVLPKRTISLKRKDSKERNKDRGPKPKTAERKETKPASPAE
jgi:hypothetical protein